MAGATGTEETRRLILWTIAMMVLAIVLAWAAYLALDALLIIYVSVLFAMGFSPIVRIIERQQLLPVGTRRFPRWLAILMIYFTAIVVLVGIGSLIVPPVVEQARALWKDLPELEGRLQEYLISWGILDRRITLAEALNETGTGDAVATVTGAIWSIVGGIFGLLMIFILSFYLLLDAQSLSNTLLRLLPARRRARVAKVMTAMGHKVSAWLIGQIIVSGFIGVTAGIGLAIIGVPYFYVLALVAAVLELIPIIGPILAAIPAVLLAATHSYTLALITAAFFLVQQQFESHVLTPKVMEQQVGISAASVVVALLIGGSIAGIAGAILAVPTAAILQVLIHEVAGLPDDDL
jgi:predicted PurR-regulated permease PerM